MVDQKIVSMLICRYLLKSTEVSQQQGINPNGLYKNSSRSRASSLSSYTKV
jgi:hypothetical protein